jgi:hypothetical protein
MLKNPTPHLSLCEREGGAFFGQSFSCNIPMLWAKRNFVNIFLFNNPHASMMLTIFNN